MDVLMGVVKKEYCAYIKELLAGQQPAPFPVLSERLLARTMAAVTVQRYWKGSRVRKWNHARKRIRENEAARMLQRWVRDLKFRHRYKFML